MLGFQLRQRGLCFGKPGRQIVHLCFQCRFRLGSCLGGGFGPFLRLLHRRLNCGFGFLLCDVVLITREASSSGTDSQSGGFDFGGMSFDMGSMPSGGDMPSGGFPGGGGGSGSGNGGGRSGNR